MNISYFIPFTTLNAGDNWKWTISNPKYSANDNWSLSYTFHKKDTPSKTFVSSAGDDGISHLINVPMSTTSEFSNGIFQCSVALIDPDGNKNTLGVRDIEIKPDLSKVATDFDSRSQDRKCLDALDAVLYRNAGRDTLETIFKDTTVKYKSFQELLSLRQHYFYQIYGKTGLKIFERL